MDFLVPTPPDLVDRHAPTDDLSTDRHQVADCPEQSEVEMAERRHDRAQNSQVLV
jgi:hypothetical protein